MLKFCTGKINCNAEKNPTSLTTDSFDDSFNVTEPIVSLYILKGIGITKVKERSWVERILWKQWRTHKNWQVLKGKPKEEVEENKEFQLLYKIFHLDKLWNQKQMVNKAKGNQISQLQPIKRHNMQLRDPWHSCRLVGSRNFMATEFANIAAVFFLANVAIKISLFF